MSKIYKYASVDSGLKIIESNAVALNNPKNYNDPFDSIIDFNKEDIDKAISLISEYVFTQEFLKVLNNDNIKANKLTKLIIKWDRLMIKFYHSIYRRNRRYESIPLFKSISKTMLKYMSKTDDKFKEYKQKFINEIINKVKEVRDSTLISCFSKKNDSILMWSHYGDKHSGVCIEYDYPSKNFKDVIYSIKRKPFRFYEITKVLLSYMLDNSRVDSNDKNVINSILSPFLTKSSDWKYEEEVRCIYFNDDINIERNGNLTLLHMPTKISAIYCGCKITNENKKMIKEIANSKGIPVFYFTNDDKLFKLNIHNQE